MMLMFLAAVARATLDTGYLPKERGKPIFIHPRAVVYRVSTVDGIASFILGFPRAYEESLPSDFKGIDEFVRNEFNSLFETPMKLKSPRTVCPGPVTAHSADRTLTGVFSTAIAPLPCETVDTVRLRVRIAMNEIKLKVQERVEQRNSNLRPHTHVFERLYRDGTVSHKDWKDDDTLTSVSWIPKGVLFKQTFPAVEFSVEKDILPTRANFASLSVYLKWSELNSVVTERRAIDPSWRDNGEIIIPGDRGITCRRRSSNGNRTVQFTLNEGGAISIACIESDERAYLFVTAKDSNHMVEAGLMRTGRVIWRGVNRVCDLMLGVL